MVSSLLVGVPDFLSSGPNSVAPPQVVVRHHPEFLIAEVADFFDLAFSFLGELDLSLAFVAV